MRIYSTRWLVLRRRAGSHSTCSTSNNIRVAWTSHNFYFTGTRNRMSYQEYTRYIPSIFKVYTKCRPVDKLLNPVAGLAPRLFIVQLSYNLTSTCVCPIFSRDIFVIIFLILWISWISFESLESVMCLAWRRANRPVLLCCPKRTLRLACFRM